MIWSPNSDSPPLHSGAPPDFVHWLRCRELLCREIWRSIGNVDCEQDFLDFCCLAMVRELEIRAGGIWREDQESETWQLLAVAGEFDVPLLRHQLGEIPLGVPVSISDEINRTSPILTAGQRIMQKPSASRSSPISGGAASCETATGEILVVGLWADDLPGERLDLTARMAAQDLAEGLCQFRRDQENRELAGLAMACLNDAPFATITLDAEGRCLRWGDAATRMFGWAPSDAVGTSLKILPEDSHQVLLEQLTDCLHRFATVRLCLPGQRWDGSRLDLDLMLLPFAHVSGRKEVLLFAHDESRSRVADKYLRIQLDAASFLFRSKQTQDGISPLLEVICEGLQWPVGEFWMISSDNRWRCEASWMNKPRGIEFADDHNVPKDVEKAAATKQIVWPRTAERISDLLKPGRAANDALAIPVCRNDQVLGVLRFPEALLDDEDPQLQRTLCSLADEISLALSSERASQALEESRTLLGQMRKMDAIGMLAGGIAHDFNNLLTIIQGNCELALDPTSPDSPLKALLEDILGAATRATSLTRRLLMLSRKRQTYPEILNLNDQIQEMKEMLQRLLSVGISLEVETEKWLGHVRVDAVEFEQVLLNLVANARDAMPSGGTVTIRTRTVQVELRDVAHIDHVRPGEFIAVSVEDNGCGMDAETKNHLFEPFFTTKEMGHGTGLGLATVDGMMRRAGGFVTVTSEPGMGTCFTVHFPRVAVGLAPRKVSQQPTPDPRGTETILVVDDEGLIRQLVQRILEVHGYSVMIATDGQQALDILDRKSPGADLLISDVVMPEMTGLQLLEAVKRRHPHFPVLLISGYSESREPSPQQSQVPLLQKPFTSEALTRAVRALLDNPVSSHA